MIKVEWKEVPFPHTKIKTPFLLFGKKKIPYLVPVRKENVLYVGSHEKKLYQTLCDQNYYVTPNVKCGRFFIDFALIPYQIAIVKLKNHVNQLKCEKFLTKKGWKVIFYSDEELETNFQEIVRKINTKAEAYLKE